MKTLLRFILNLTVTVAIMIPCIFFFKRIEELGVLDWLEVMIILGAMSILNERCKLYGKVKNRNELVVVAEYTTQSEAKAKQTVLKAQGIESISVMKENPMYIKSESNAPIQLQVMSKDAEKAKELIG